MTPLMVGRCLLSPRRLNTAWLTVSRAMAQERTMCVVNSTNSPSVAQHSLHVQCVFRNAEKINGQEVVVKVHLRNTMLIPIYGGTPMACLSAIRGIGDWVEFSGASDFT